MAAKKKAAPKRHPGLKVDGTLKKGYRYAAGGRIVKAGCTTKKPGRVCSTRKAKTKRAKK